MKNVIIIFLAFWIFILYKAKAKAAAIAATAPAASGGGGMRPPAETQKSGGGVIPVLDCYGNPSDPAGNQNATFDVSESNVLGYSRGDKVKVLNSSLYPLYYTVLEIKPGPSGSPSIVLDALYVGYQSGLYLTNQYNVSGFNPVIKKRGAFL